MIINFLAQLGIQTKLSETESHEEKESLTSKGVCHFVSIAILHLKIKICVYIAGS